MRYSLLASASLMAFAFTVSTAPASAADCGCRDAVRAALAKQAPVVQRAKMPAIPPPAKRAAARVTRRVTIPRLGGAESLNAAIAAAIVCDNLRRVQARG